MVEVGGGVEPVQVELLVGLISHQLGPTVFWALFSHPDRGRPTLHGWWAPVAQRYKGKVGAGARMTRFTAPPVTPPTS